jgi:hypothetical protein
VAAKAVIVEEVERPRRRLWNAKPKDAQIGIDHIRAVTHHFRGECGERKSIVPLRELWAALHALDGYLTDQSDWLVNFTERQSAGLRVGTTITEGTANFLVKLLPLFIWMTQLLPGQNRSTAVRYRLRTRGCRYTIIRMESKSIDVINTSQSAI